MKWARVFAELGKAAGIVVLVPAVLMVRLRWDSILPIIIYFQLLLIWIQAEISLRQNQLYAAQFEPLFDVQVTGASRMALTIENVSDKPAYMLSVSRFTDQNHKPLPPAQWTNKVDCPRTATLVPGGKLPLCTVKDEDFAKLIRQLHMSVEVSYFDPLGKWQSLVVTFFDDDLLLTPARGRLPGFVLNTFEALSLTWTFLRFEACLRNGVPKFAFGMRLSIALPFQKCVQNQPVCGGPESESTKMGVEAWKNVRARDETVEVGLIMLANSPKSLYTPMPIRTVDVDVSLLPGTFFPHGTPRIPSKLSRFVHFVVNFRGYEACIKLPVERIVWRHNSPLAQPTLGRLSPGYPFVR